MYILLLPLTIFELTVTSGLYHEIGYVGHSSVQFCFGNVKIQLNIKVIVYLGLFLTKIDFETVFGVPLINYLRPFHVQHLE